MILKKVKHILSDGNKLINKIHKNINIKNKDPNRSMMYSVI
jgi:hypothetical protein